MNRIIIIVLLLLGTTHVNAKVILPSIFSDHMMLQRNQTNTIWGKAKKGEQITVAINGQIHSTKADKTGNWRTKLDSMKAGGPYTITVKGKKNTITIKDVLVGEVWVCSGQSNMGWRVSGTNFPELESVSANFPNIRLLKTPTVGNLKPQFTNEAKWEQCSPESVKDFSANGYFFGKRLHQTLGVPIGLINVAWGASALETWIPRDVMEATGEYTEMLTQWDERMSNYTDTTLKKEVKEYEAWKEGGKKGKRMNPARDHRIGQNTPANGFNNMVNPIVGYGIKGAIWCQGETNLGRAYQYRRMFPLLINTWRKQWNQGDFPFYWVQVAGLKDKPTKAEGSFWAEMHEAQTITLSLPNTGEAIVYDLGVGNDIHFKDKQTSANRLVMHALSNDYGIEMKAKSPSFESMKIVGDKAIITFKDVKSKLYAFRTNEVKGFTIAGADKKFVFAKAKIIGKKKVEISAKGITKPVSVRFAWANNPDANLYDKAHLPVKVFRTDDWELMSFGNEKANR